MEGQCSTGQSPLWAVVPMEEEYIEELKDAIGNAVMTQDRTCCDKHVKILPMCWMCNKFRFCGLLH